MNVRDIINSVCGVVLTTQLFLLQPVLDIFSSYSVGSTRHTEPAFGLSVEPQRESAIFAYNTFAPSKIRFVGDVMLARNVELLMRKKGVEYPFSGNVFTSQVNQYLVGNFESAIPVEHVPTEIEQLNFSVDPALLTGITEIGFTHFSLANNHSSDHGAVGLINTRKELVDDGLTVFGDPNEINNGSLTFLDCGNKVVALIGLQALDTVSLQKVETLLSKATQRSDLQIVYVHWGTEYELTANEQQRALAEFFITAGADLIVGHHPHVIQNIDLIAGVPVFYSLGNFIFDQYFSKNTQQGLVISLDLETGIIELLPVTSEQNPSQPHLMSEVERSKFLTDLSKRSASELREHIIEGTLLLDSLVATSSKIAMIDL
jgi:hypothetical protein